MWINIIIQTTTAERIDITTIVAKSTEAVHATAAVKIYAILILKLD